MKMSPTGDEFYAFRRRPDEGPAQIGESARNGR
jgi:hypothetical protein